MIRKCLNRANKTVVLLNPRGTIKTHVKWAVLATAKEKK